MIVALPAEIVALTPGDLDEQRPEEIERCVDVARRAIAAGLRAVLVREPGLSDRAFLAFAREIGAVLEAHAGWLGVHDRVHLAVACGAHAVHLGFRSLAPEEARAIVPAEIAIGLSAHADDDESRWRAADYLFFGPVRDTPSKRGWKDPVGFETLGAVARRTTTPIWAIGGLARADLARVRAAGCRGIALRRAAFEAYPSART